MSNEKHHVARPSKAFPRPWTLEIKGSYLNIKAANGDYVISDWDISVDPSVGMMGDPEADVANFELIVSAVNSKEELVSLLEEWVKARADLRTTEYFDDLDNRTGHAIAAAKGVANETA